MTVEMGTGAKLSIRKLEMTPEGYNKSWLPIERELQGCFLAGGLRFCRRWTQTSGGGVARQVTGVFRRSAPGPERHVAMIRRVNVLDQPVADSTLRDAAKFSGLLWVSPAPRSRRGGWRACSPLRGGSQRNLAVNRRMVVGFRMHKSFSSRPTVAVAAFAGQAGLECADGARSGVNLGIADSAFTGHNADFNPGIQNLFAVMV